MSHQRLRTLKGMVRFHDQRRSSIKEQIAAQRLAIRQLETCREAYRQSMSEIGDQIAGSSMAVWMVQQCEVAAMYYQRHIEDLTMQIRVATQALDALTTQFMEWDRKTKSWEKLAEQKAAEFQRSEITTEMRQADERHLALRHNGGRP